jgi:hypothetical protein
MQDAGKFLYRPRRHQDMHMVRHDHKSFQCVTHRIKVAQRAGHHLGTCSTPQAAGAMSRIEPLMKCGRESLMIFVPQMIGEIFHGLS